MAKKKKIGKAERKRIRSGAVRRPALRQFYDRKMEPIVPGAFGFRVLVSQGAKQGGFRSLGDSIEAISWSDEGPVTTGSLTLRRPDPRDSESLGILAGSRARLMVSWEDKLIRLWEMRILDVPEVDLISGVVTVSLEDALAPLGRNARDWEFRDDKGHPNGWKAHQVAKEAAKREGIKVGRLAEGSEGIRSLVRRRVPALEIIRLAYEREKAKTGRSYVIRLSNSGELEVVEYGRNRVVFETRGIEIAASARGSRKPRPITVIHATGRVKGANGKNGKVEATISRDKLVKRFGFAMKRIDYGRVQSRKDLREKGKRDLAREVEPTRTATITIPGVPFIRRGDVFRWHTSERGWSGESEKSRDRSFTFVRAASHSVSGASYETTLDLTQRDPYVADRRRADQAARRQKRRERARNR